MSDINRWKVASPLEVISGSHTLGPVLEFEVDLILRKTMKTAGNLALLRVDSPTCYLALLYASLEVACALQVVFPLPPESSLFPDKSRRLLLRLCRFGNTTLSGGSGFDSMFKAR
jgi:hypothetical protein